MSSFDLMIEKYSKELIDAKRRSILNAIEEDEWTETITSEEDERAETAASENVKEFYSDNGLNKNEQKNLNSEKAEHEVISEQTIKEEESVKEKDKADSVTNANVNVDTVQADKTNKKSSASDENTSTGTLRVQVYAADRVYPITSAFITVSDSDGKNEFFQGYTDTSGVVDGIVLPAPPREMSGSPSIKLPYAQYDITASHPNFKSRKYTGVPVFGGVRSIQNVQLVPIESNNTTEDVNESGSNDLLLKREVNQNG